MKSLLLSGMASDCWMEGWWFSRQQASKELLLRGSAPKNSLSILSGKSGSLNTHLDGNRKQKLSKCISNRYVCNDLASVGASYHPTMLTEPYRLWSRQAFRWWPDLSFLFFRWFRTRTSLCRSSAPLSDCRAAQACTFFSAASYSLPHLLCLLFNVSPFGAHPWGTRQHQ